MSNPIQKVNIKGRPIGIFAVTIIQALTGVIHTFFGAILLLGSYVPLASSSPSPTIFNTYTLVYGTLTTFFAYLFWKGKRIGWIGTIAVTLFVIVVDTLALFDLFNVLGILKSATIGEIIYSLFILLYLIQDHVRLKYNI